MATYVFTHNGQKYQITAPDSTPPDQVAAQFRQHFAAQQSQQSQQPQQAPQQVQAPQQQQQQQQAQQAQPQVPDYLQSELTKTPSAGSFLQGVGDAAFGVGTPITAALKYAADNTLGSGSTWDQAYSKAKQIVQKAFTDNPTTFRAGEAVGFIGGAKGLSSGIGAAGKMLEGIAPKAAQVVKTVLSLQEGQPYRNAGRMALAGGAAGAVTAGNQTGRAEDAATGALAGSVLSPVAGPVSAAAPRLFSKAARSVPAWASTLAKKAGVTAEQLFEDHQTMSAAVGRDLSVGEILSMEKSAKLNRSVFRTNPDAANVLVAGAARSAAARGPAMAELSGAGPLRETPAALSLSNQADTRLTQFMDDYRDTPVALTSAELEPILEHELPKGASQYEQSLANQGRRRVSRVLRAEPTVYAKIMGAAEDASKNKTVELTLGDIDQVRRTLGTVASALDRHPESVAAIMDKSPDSIVNGTTVRQLAGHFEDIGRRAEPGYGAALDEYRAVKTQADALHTAPSALGNMDPADFSASIREGGTMDQRPQFWRTEEHLPAWQRAAAVNTRRDLVSDALKSPRSAITLAQRLAEDGNLRSRLTDVIGKEATDSLVNMGTVETRVARNVSSLADIRTREAPTTDALQVAQSVAAALSPGLSMPYKVWWAGRMVQKFGVRKSTALSLANNLSDPKKVPLVLKALKQYGIGQDEVLNSLRTFSLGAGAAAGSGLTSTDVQGGNIDTEPER